MFYQKMIFRAMSGIELNEDKKQQFEKHESFEDVEVHQDTSIDLDVDN